ncbi:MAG: M23 family metallopeptidase [Hyphomonas sp.]|uniref:M23 family metallopeptidase n=1 Tax=Hyphomonas sp. TaxID=87 RepID=UPI0034A08D02
MKQRVGWLLVALLMLGACASQPAPVIVYGPPVDYGPPGDIRNPPQGPFQPNAYLRLCPGMGVSNAPAHDSERWITGYKPVILVGQVVVVTAPVNDVCLSSGFGLRGSRMHEGIDLASRPPGTIHAAAPGRVIEARNSSGYGLQVLIDHGHGVYTRYAHLDSFDPGLTLGGAIGFGQPVGQMGATGNAEAPHLHFELLTGDYSNSRGSKGLTPNDPFAFPAYDYLGY